jgi:hypothetical protein
MTKASLSTDSFISAASFQETCFIESGTSSGRATPRAVLTASARPNSLHVPGRSTRATVDEETPA